MKKILLLILLLAVTSCATPTPTYLSLEATPDAPDVIYSTKISGLLRVVDEDAGVVCWVWVGPQGVGIDCLPLEQTRLER